MASTARKARLRPVLLASCCSLVLVERARRTETVSMFIGVQDSTRGGLLPQGGRLQEASGETPVLLKDSGPNPDKVLFCVVCPLTSRRG